MSQDTGETTPLLSARAPATPLPKLQLSILLLMRMAEPVAYTVIFPFINQMMEEVTQLPKSKVGYYAGLVESVFAMIQFFTVYHWGALSDRLGRKIVALIGIVGAMVSVAAFGLSRSLPMMILTRCIAGAMNGNVAIVKSMMAEMTDETNQARAYSLMPVAWAFGATIGPLIGGYLSHPAERYPEWFGESAFLVTYPYFLPCFVASLVNLLVIIIGIIYLEETLVAKIKQLPSEAPSPSSSGTLTPVDDATTPGSGTLTPVYDASSAEAQEVAPQKPTLFTDQIVRVLSISFFMFLLSSCYQALIPLFCYSPYEAGGIGFPPSSIGLLLSVTGVTAMFSQAFLFPIIERRLGPVRTFRLAMSGLPFIYIALPVAHYLSPLGRPTVWTVLAFMIVAKTIGHMGVVCNSILINNAAPSRESLGRLNGIVQSTGSLARAFGPAGITALFAFSQEHHLLDGQLVHLVLITIAIVAYLMTGRLRDVRATWRQKRT
ncbi:major facilitator superfamily domain-containing protein [Schizophyllum amplum]|uniref:Major facilitator superfamily domain-containing protein n=1 Tax=Schizophyllum amplum TaxID=97359 RepID=A0A550BXY0_9AGAR|nr:major facilitator superfamily domain-containing protein [Auriculariopsis ampla]